MNLAAILVLSLLCFCWLASAEVVLIGKNVTLSFIDVEATFTPTIKSSGECGVLYKAEPLEACSDLTNEVEKVSNGSSPFVLIIRGGCRFEEKVKRAQKAGFKAAIIYDDEDGGMLVSMAGTPSGIMIHAVFITKESGEILNQYAGSTNMELWLIPSFESSAWSILMISFISLLIMSALLATCFFVRRYQIRHRRPQSSRVREFHGMSSHLVKAMPSLIFTAVLEDNSTSSSCAICLEDYNVGDKLRILPCRHKFHAICVDSWLTAWRTFCPVCKRDARTSNSDPPASESTPLLSSSPASSSSFLLTPSRSPLQSSSNVQIAPTPQSPSVSVSPSHSLANTPCLQQSHRSYHCSPHITISRSSVDFRNAYSQISYVSPLMGSSPNSLVYPPTSPLNTRYMSRYGQSPSNASPSFVESSGHRENPLRCSESAGTFSPLASANSLPDC